MNISNDSDKFESPRKVHVYTALVSCQEVCSSTEGPCRKQGAAMVNSSYVVTEL